MKGQIRILLVDDHPVVRRGLATCLSAEETFAIVGEASDGIEALEQTARLSPDVILMDIDMPRMTGLAATAALQRTAPKSRVLVLTVHANADYVLRIIEAGAKGYVVKDASPEQLIQAIRRVHSGETYFSPDVARVAISCLVHGAEGAKDGSHLTPREREVLILIAEGLSNKEIGSRLDVGVRTIETHRERIMRKLGIHTIAGLTKYAISRKFISVRED
ncbi:MAG TPA: response regulator transcription factor [Clostridia bacterium]|nr:response regulator transcription factor [Clostridia bacterium]